MPDPFASQVVLLPTADEIRRAVALYLELAYHGESPASAGRLIPPEVFEPTEWLMSDLAERDPSNAPLANVRSFALRLGNWQYPHMKVRLSRPPNDRVFVFSVDAHDAFLDAPAGSPDRAALEELKRNNAAIAATVLAAWDASGLLTERNYLRQKIRQARDEQVNSDSQRPQAR